MLKKEFIKQVVQSTLCGIDESMHTYQKWSGEEWLWNAPEYLLTVKIAENISKINSTKYITLEDNVNYILDHTSKSNKKNISKETRLNGRTDITIWNNDSKTQAIIEVKNTVYRLSDIEKDVIRIKNLLENSSLEFGLIAFYIDKHFKTGNAKQRIEDRKFRGQDT